MSGDPDRVTEQRARFDGMLGAAFLRNTLRIPEVTCLSCAGPLTSGQLCKCIRHQQDASSDGARLADLVVTLAYAVRYSQSARLLYTYKQTDGTPEMRRRVGMLLHSALSLHRECIETAVGQPITAWAIVPSTKTPDAPQPLRRIVEDVFEFFTGSLGGEVRLNPGAGFMASSHRFIPNLWDIAASTSPSGQHVLVIDDTWTTGGNAQSAAAALSAAGAAAVTILAIARWVNPDFGDNQHFIDTHLDKRYDVFACPAPGSTCPWRVTK